MEIPMTPTQLKFTAVTMIVFGVCWAWTWRHDNVEGRFMAPLACLLAIGGLLLYIEIIRKQVMDSLRELRVDS
jgi:hypothetical protein